MDELIEDLKAAMIREIRGTGIIDAHKLASLTSSYKDLCIARLVEELRTGRVELAKWGTAFKLRKSY